MQVCGPSYTNKDLKQGNLPIMQLHTYNIARQDCMIAPPYGEATRSASIFARLEEDTGKNAPSFLYVQQNSVAGCQGAKGAPVKPSHWPLERPREHVTIAEQHAPDTC
jgi:hypothetical protein